MIILINSFKTLLKRGLKNCWTWWIFFSRNILPILNTLNCNLIEEASDVIMTEEIAWKEKIIC
jgi:hypothetical protein